MEAGALAVQIRYHAGLSALFVNENNSYSFSLMFFPSGFTESLGQLDVEFLGNQSCRMQKVDKKLVDLQIFKAIVDVDFSYFSLCRI